MRLERTEAARIAKKLKDAKKTWTGKKRTSSHRATLPPLDPLRNGKMTALDLTLDQQFMPLVSDSESEYEKTFDQSIICIPVPKDLLGKFGATINLE